MKKKAIVAGHICLDITPVFPHQKSTKLFDILAPGKLLNVGDADVHTGGSVANTGLAMKILGADVALMGKIGRDVFGDMIYSALQKYGAEEGLIISEKESTSYSIVLAIPEIDRIFLHNPGANHTFCSADIPQKILEEAALFHFGYPPLMKSMYENGGEELVRIMKRAKKCGAATSLDFASIDADSEAGRADWNTILKNAIPYVDILVPSVEELCYMLDQERFLDWQVRAKRRDIIEILDIEKDVKPLADKCMELGAKILLIKCGALGIYYETADSALLQMVGHKLELDSHIWAGKCGFEKSYVPEEVLSGTGAGDTCIAAFLTAILEGYTLDHALRLAVATGASCVASYDALSGLKSFEELDEKINAGWEKNEFYS